MKTLFINGSPKKGGGVSAYLLGMLRFMCRGEKNTLHIRSGSDHPTALEALREADAVAFALPLYVDGIPSHMLRFLEAMETFCRENDLAPKVYVIANGGFIEGRQNKPLMQVFENFCARSGCTWCGGIGIGGGVMVNVLRILFFVYSGIFLLNAAASGMQGGSWLPAEALTGFAGQCAAILFFQLGILFYMVRAGIALNKRVSCGTGYTRVLVPSFLFILMADLFFLLTSLFQGGLFRGWLAKK